MPYSSALGFLPVVHAAAEGEDAARERLRLARLAGDALHVAEVDDRAAARGEEAHGKAKRYVVPACRSGRERVRG